MPSAEREAGAVPVLIRRQRALRPAHSVGEVPVPKTIPDDGKVVQATKKEMVSRASTTSPS